MLFCTRGTAGIVSLTVFISIFCVSMFVCLFVCVNDLNIKM